MASQGEVIADVLAIVATKTSTMDALVALGRVKDYVREREVYLVTRARQESHAWTDIAEALHRDLSLMELLHGRPRHER